MERRWILMAATLLGVAQSGCLLADLDLLGHEIARGGPLGERIRDNEYGGITATRVAARMKEALDPASVEVQWDIVFDHGGKTNRTLPLVISWTITGETSRYRG